jgi:hypothetical protein
MRLNFSKIQRKKDFCKRLIWYYFKDIGVQRQDFQIVEMENGERW